MLKNHLVILLDIDFDCRDEQTSPNQGQFRETSRRFEPYKVDIDKSKTNTTVDRELTKKEIEEKTKDILEEYLHLQDMVVNWPRRKYFNVKPFARSRQCTQIPYK